jgi:tetratricopeptide (TPR) repeat protein
VTARRSLLLSGAFLLSFLQLPAYSDSSAGSSAASPVASAAKAGTSAAKAAAAPAKASKTTSTADVEKLLSAKNAGYENHMVAARFFEARGLLSQAEEQYHLAISFKEAKPEAFKNLAQLLLRTEDQKEAENVILAAVKNYPTDYGVLLNAGFVLHNCHKLPQALALYKRASIVRPASSDIWLAMGDVLIDMNKPEEALASIEKALAMPGPTNLAYFEDAKALLALGRLKDAVVPFSKNFASNPFNYTSGLAYSALLQKLGRLEEALNVRLCLLAVSSGKPMDDLKLMTADLLMKLPADAVQRSIRFAELKIGNPKTQAILHFALGDIYDRAHQPDNGIIQYKAGLSLNPDYSRGYLRLGEDYEDAKSNLPEALNDYEKAYSLNARDPEIKSRLEKLRARIKSQKK